MIRAQRVRRCRKILSRDARTLEIAQATGQTFVLSKVLSCLVCRLPRESSYRWLISLVSLQQSSLGQVAAISQARSIGLDIVDLGKSTSSQKTLWSSAYLKQVAVLAATSALSSDEKTRSSQPADFALQAFRLWTSRFSGKAPQTSQDQVEALTAIPSDKQAWHEYYELLSQILQQSVLSSALNERSARGQLIAEFRRTEAQFESILLRDLKFPKATENNWKIEAFVERVILNWKVLCGPGWTDADFGEGGQDAVGRNMLDVSIRLSLPISPISIFSRSTDSLSRCHKIIPFDHYTSVPLLCALFLIRV